MRTLSWVRLWRVHLFLVCVCIIKSHFILVCTRDGEQIHTACDGIFPLVWSIFVPLAVSSTLDSEAGIALQVSQNSIPRADIGNLLFSWIFSFLFTPLHLTFISLCQDSWFNRINPGPSGQQWIVDCPWCYCLDLPFPLVLTFVNWSQSPLWIACNGRTIWNPRNCICREVGDGLCVQV